jgi:hypothetical protein
VVFTPLINSVTDVLVAEYMIIRFGIILIKKLNKTSIELQQKGKSEMSYKQPEIDIATRVVRQDGDHGETCLEITQRVDCSPSAYFWWHRMTLSERHAKALYEQLGRVLKSVRGTSDE